MGSPRDVWWFHGEPAPRETWANQRWDRDPFTSSPNEEGPGIYFTNKEDEAATYGPFIYAGKLKPTFRLMPKRKPTLRDLREFLSYASDDDRENFLSNWDPPNERTALQGYLRQDTLHDALLMLSIDLFRRDDVEWVKAVLALGYDGVMKKKPTYQYPQRVHLIVWDPYKMYLQRME